VTYLLDTNVVSALRRPALNPAVTDWARSVPVSELFVSAFTIAEIERGVRMSERRDAAQGAVLRDWLESGILPGFAGRVLPFDLAAARILAGWPVPESAPVDDAQIAAVAAAHGKTVVTRHARHFDALGVPLLDPWQEARPR
jgi:predicted nucleic acid-binding protein